MGRGLEVVRRLSSVGTSTPSFLPLSSRPYPVLATRAEGGAGTPLTGPAPPPAPPPASRPQGQEAPKELPGAMDGAVMEGPLFLQSQRFGTKVVGGRGCRTPSGLEVSERVQPKGGGEYHVGARSWQLERPVTFSRNCFAHSREGCAVSGYALIDAGGPSWETLPLNWECQTSNRPARVPPLSSWCLLLAYFLLPPPPLSLPLSPEVEEDLGRALPGQSPWCSAARVL